MKCIRHDVSGSSSGNAMSSRIGPTGDPQRILWGERLGFDQLARRGLGLFRARRVVSIASVGLVRPAMGPVKVLIELEKLPVIFGLNRVNLGRELGVTTIPLSNAATKIEVTPSSAAVFDISILVQSGDALRCRLTAEPVGLFGQDDGMSRVADSQRRGNAPKTAAQNDDVGSVVRRRRRTGADRHEASLLNVNNGDLLRRQRRSQRRCSDNDDDYRAGHQEVCGHGGILGSVI